MQAQNEIVKILTRPYDRNHMRIYVSRFSFF